MINAAGGVITVAVAAAAKRAVAKFHERFPSRTEITVEEDEET
jgi:ABC-type molybdate transport system substrate-binding protein